jgi:hypothetical protein
MDRRNSLLLAFVVIATAAVPARADQPDGVVRWHGEGEQIYDCQKSATGTAWVLRQPDATLTDVAGRVEGHHGAGPSWTAADGSRITGHAITTIPAPREGAIPWLVVQADSHDGAGLLDHVTYVMRTETVGGIAPAGGCDLDHEGAVATVPYQATYSFLDPVQPPG